MDQKPVSVIKAQRRKLKLNQSQFWAPVGVTQSGGSRYESDRNVPNPVSLLLGLAYGKNPLKQLAKLRGVTVEQLIESGK